MIRLPAIRTAHIRPKVLFSVVRPKATPPYFFIHNTIYYIVLFVKHFNEKNTKGKSILTRGGSFINYGRKGTLFDGNMQSARRHGIVPTGAFKIQIKLVQRMELL